MNRWFVEVEKCCPAAARRRGNGMAATGLLVEIGDRLRLRREELGMTQKEAADLLEMSETFYGEIERGNRRLSIERMILVHERMDMSLTWLLAGEQPIVIPEGITRQLPEEKVERMERLFRDLAKLYE